MDAKALLRELDAAWLHCFRGSTVSFGWLEESLKAGERLPEYKFAINYEEEFKPKKAAVTGDSGTSQAAKRSKMSSEDPGNDQRTRGEDRENELAAGGHKDASAQMNEDSGGEKRSNQYASSQSSSGGTKDTVGSHGSFDIEEASSGGPSIYAPADLNRNITKIFGRLIDIYRGKCTLLANPLIH
uniref:BRCT domain-containing protein n=1 Tax=Arundo donax TaxID=35708 RepID=A0A0A9FD71_ARUDO